MSKVIDGWLYPYDSYDRGRPMPRNYFHIELDFFTLPEPRKETEEERKIRERDESYFEFCKKIYGE